MTLYQQFQHDRAQRVLVAIAQEAMALEWTTLGDSSYPHALRRLAYLFAIDACERRHIKTVES